jgi:hypothetical protein
MAKRVSDHAPAKIIGDEGGASDKKDYRDHQTAQDPVWSIIELNRRYKIDHSIPDTFECD